jgi:protein-tyrosine phosphatase
VNADLRILFSDGTQIDVPLMTWVSDNLWHGGCMGLPRLPVEIKHVVSLTSADWYVYEHELLSHVYVSMRDELDQGFEQVDLLAQWVNECRKTGPALVHCQGGLNRSSLIVARALFLSGEARSGADAIEHLRDRRSPHVLFNEAFAAEVMSWRERHVDGIVRILGDASECTVDPQRADDIARRALTEACDNREGK